MKFTAPKPQNVVDPPPDRRLLLIAGGAIAAVVALLLLAMVSTDGCRNDSAALHELDSRGEKGLRGSDEHLLRAVTLLEHIEDYQQNQAIAQIMAQLGQWIADQPPLDDWSADPLAASLPKRYAFLSQPERLKQMEFVIQDYYFLSEAVWMRNVSNWQIAQRNQRREALEKQIDDLTSQLRTLDSQPSPDAAKRNELQAKIAQLQEQREPAWLAALRQAQGEAAADTLANALQLFDWTIRNVQLDKTNWDAVLPEPPDKAPAAGDPPYKVVAPPPGAELHAWQSLLLGRGDAANRGRIFLLLARQQNIEVILLGLKNKSVDGEPRPWAAGVLVGDQIYLLDPELGLPIPGPNDQGIATLAMLRENPELLRQLDLPGAPYPVTAADLQHVVALIDATPQALSQRMLLVEQKLPPEHKLALTVEPSPLQRRLRKLGLEESRIWIAPYRAFAYDQLRQRDPEANGQLETELAVYGGPLPLFPARMYHLRGQFDTQLPEPGAKALYMACRKPDREIAMIVTAPELRQQMMARNPEMKNHPEVLEALLRQTQLAAMQAKRQASYWLGLVAYEDDDLGTAIDFLAQRTIKTDPAGPWTASARYNLARVYEATRQNSQAIELYEADDSPQRHGNHIRARRLRSAS